MKRSGNSGNYGNKNQIYLNSNIEEERGRLLELFGCCDGDNWSDKIMELKSKNIEKIEKELLKSNNIILEGGGVDSGEPMSGPRILVPLELVLEQAEQSSNLG